MPTTTLTTTNTTKAANLIRNRDNNDDSTAIKSAAEVNEIQIFIPFDKIGLG